MNAVVHREPFDEADDAAVRVRSGEPEGAYELLRVEDTASSPRATGADHGVDQDLRALFGQSTAVFASLAGPKHVLEAANAAFAAVIGGEAPVRTGMPLGVLLPEAEEQGILTSLDQVYRTGERHTGSDARFLLGSGARAREAFFDFTYEPRTDQDGNVTGVHLIGIETTQVKQAQRLTAEHRALLEQIARQAPLEQVLEGMARTIEELSPEKVFVSILLADGDGRHLRHGAGPSLPEFYNRAIDGITIGDGVGSCGTAAHRRQMVIVDEIATNLYWEPYRDLADSAGVAACWSTPVLARDGTLLGTFAMYHPSPRAPQEFDLTLVRLFADTAALAIERHQVEQARVAAETREKHARDDLAFLLEASTSLSSGLDYTQTLQRLARCCVGGVAPLCAIDVLEGGRVRRIATAAATDAEEERLASQTPVYDADDDAIARVLASGASEIVRRAPRNPGLWRDLGVTGYLCVPLLERGRPFGTLTALTNGAGTFDDHSIALAEELARRAASAALNARQYTERVALARDLQAGLLVSEVPTLPAATAATFYHPAGEGLDIGGDFYDVFPLPDGTWAFLLGDVCGRGAIAATTTGLVRHTARAVAPLLPRTVSVVRAINKALLERPASHGTGFVSLVYGHLSPAHDGLDVTFVRAGHTFPVLIDARHVARTVESEGLLLGICEEPELTAHHIRLRPSESLVLYTDGITEARNDAGDQFGEERLTGTLTGRLRDGYTAQDVIVELTGAVRGFTGPGGVDDDQAALAITVSRAAASAPARCAG
ncbi:SpoIIE family protein phosphatase [Streptomyces actinomycinicus]|uniref:SpoIIE family protein phosphatase n=1 Tax=Streptomyces actinomycinicus TaxID=1695166 RepID=A0A937ETC0_9ACTN|nr:SpoIIE family protein phosphatase [Streptomyces actinomycinicus]MBL1087554.1 SpoIIE family protein phosphatase [Streptomyces actinomycinicus]